MKWEYCCCFSQQADGLSGGWSLWVHHGYDPRTASSKLAQANVVNVVDATKWSVSSVDCSVVLKVVLNEYRWLLNTLDWATLLWADKNLKSFKLKQESSEERSWQIYCRLSGSFIYIFIPSSKQEHNKIHIEWHFLEWLPLFFFHFHGIKPQWSPWADMDKHNMKVWCWKKYSFITFFKKLYFFSVFLRYWRPVW